MIKKILFLLILITLVGCNATKPVIVTKKKVLSKPKLEVVSAVKKPNSTKSNATKPVLPKPVKQEQHSTETEVIVSTSKTVVTNAVIKAYIAQFKEIAIGNMKNFGIPASIILAQGILESGAGSGTLSKNANNHFGIKCHTGWEGESVRHDDDASQECFRKYKDPAESYRDHAEFLTGRSRYANLFKLEKGDYEAWAKGLKAAGYATDPKYPDKLISYIERYNLHQYDAEVLGTNYTPITKSQPIASAPKPRPTNSGEGY
jgi:flagellum-specific peptidoglycan hydrolase FlgJ